MVLKSFKKIIRKILLNYFSNFYKNKTYGFIAKLRTENLISQRVVEPELTLLKHFINHGDCCLDVGANIGHYTFMFEKLAGSENVYAFEPILNNYIHLNGLFKNCHIHQIALSDENKMKKFKIPIINDIVFDTRGKLDIDIVESNENGFRTFDVKCETMDSFVKNKKLNKVDFIKIDVEGHELKVLEGAIKTLKQFKPSMMIEIEQRHHKINIDYIFNFITSFGYKISFYNLEKLRFEQLSNFDIEKHQSFKNIKTSKYVNNFFCFARNDV